MPEKYEHIRLDSVSKSFGNLSAVSDLSFSIKAGEVVGFLGPNGAGKTTTMRLITGYYTPDSGMINVNGLDTQKNEQKTKLSIGFLPENNPLYGDMLVCEYLNFIADLRGVPKSNRKDLLDSAIESAGIQAIYYRTIHELSKGNKQRVGMAQAILHQPEILIMDEPTEGLDPNQRVLIRDLIRSLGKDRTVLLSTHVLSEVESTCDRVLLINQGKLITDSTVDNLLKDAEGMRSISIEVKGDDVMKNLRAIQGVISVRYEGERGGNYHYVVNCKDRDIRTDIFHLAVTNNWTLSELHEERATLENVFQELTIVRN